MKENVVRVIVVQENQDGQEAANMAPAPKGMSNMAIKVLAINYDLDTGKGEYLTEETAPPSADDFIHGSRDDMSLIAANAVMGLAEDMRNGAFKSRPDSATDDAESNAYLRLLIEVLAYPREVIANILASLLMDVVEPLACANDDEYADMVEGLRAEMIMPRMNQG